MKQESILTRFYIFSVYLLGLVILVWNLISWQIEEPLMLVILCILASLGLIIKVEGATDRSHYTFSFIAFGFAFVHLGIAATFIVAIVSNLVEWLVKRPRKPWYLPVFNSAGYIIVLQTASIVYDWINPDLVLGTFQSIMAFGAAMMVFTFLNHLIVGIVVWIARGENFRESGIFDILTLIIDMSLLTIGGMMVLLWNFNPYSLLLFIFPIYMIYGTMRVPSLERKTELDQKTGLYNHAYFMEQLDNELRRSIRYDRPLTIIMADLDLLRNINNTYGHLAGDEVLLGIANILRESVREYDVVSRFGGEEFAILMPESEVTQGHERAEHIRKVIEQAEFTISTSVTPIKVTISLGIATREYLDQTAQDIIHNADTALYHSKLNGRNRAFAYSNDAYLDFIGSEYEPDSSLRTQDHQDPAQIYVVTEPTEYLASKAKIEHPSVSSPDSQPLDDAETTRIKPGTKSPKTPVYLFIAGLFTVSLLLFGSLYLVTPNLYTGLPLQSWLGIAGCALLVILTEMYSIDLYTKNTSLSTSAVPILAGTLLFGPIGSFFMSLTYAISTGVKYRNPFNRIIFNFSNQLVVGMVYTSVILLSGRPYIELPTLQQLIFAVLAVTIVYVVNTVMISVGMYLDTRQPLLPFWKEQYGWLFPIYLGMGIVAAAFVFGYKHDPLIGTLLIIVPLVLLRISQVQYVERTRDMVSELRKKNIDLEKYSDDISKLNEGLLETLAEIIDLRDPYVLGHSRRVTKLATKLARGIGLHEKQVELVRKGSLLHDIGKLGISKSILGKPSRLTTEEYEVMKTHPKLGAVLLEKSPHLRPLIPIVHQHHEYYNGRGYPEGLAGNQIDIEARIVSIADAVEAMLSDRPYRKSRSMEYIIEELKRCSGTQFDPQIIEAAIQVISEIEPVKITEKYETSERV